MRDAAEYFGFSLGDRLTIEIGQRISFNIAASTAGSLSFEINSKNAPQLNIYENKEVKKGDTLTTRSFEAEPPEDHGEFILNFTSSDGQTDILRIPFELRKNNFLSAAINSFSISFYIARPNLFAFFSKRINHEWKYCVD